MIDGIDLELGNDKDGRRKVSNQVLEDDVPNTMEMMLKASIIPPRTVYKAHAVGMFQCVMWVPAPVRSVEIWIWRLVALACHELGKLSTPTTNVTRVRESETLNGSRFSSGKMYGFTETSHTYVFAD
jgi:hypothetical protein